MGGEGNVQRPSASTSRALSSAFLPLSSSLRFFNSFLSLSAVNLFTAVMSMSPSASAAGSSSEMASDLRFLLPPEDFLPFLAAGFFGSGLSRSGIVAPAALASFSNADALRLSSASVWLSESARLRAAAASRDAASAATCASASAAAAASAFLDASATAAS